MHGLYPTTPHPRRICTANSHCILTLHTDTVTKAMGWVKITNSDESQSVPLSYNQVPMFLEIHKPPNWKEVSLFFENFSNPESARMIATGSDEPTKTTCRELIRKSCLGSSGDRLVWLCTENIFDGNAHRQKILQSSVDLAGISSLNWT